MPALKPYWGKPTVRNFRGDDGNGGIIRSPQRAIVLPDRNAPSSYPTAARSEIPRADPASDKVWALIQARFLVSCSFGSGRVLRELRAHKSPISNTDISGSTADRCRSGDASTTNDEKLGGAANGRRSHSAGNRGDSYNCGRGNTDAGNTRHRRRDPKPGPATPSQQVRQL